MIRSPAIVPIVLLLVVSACAPPTEFPTATSTTSTATAGAFVPSVSTGMVTTPPVSSVPGTVRVVEVVDGDTIKVDFGGKVETVRVIGLDTPETVDPREPVQCFGREASAKAKEILSGQQVSLVEDSSQGERDKYGRLLRYVDRVDGADFGLWMIGNGFAHEYTYDKPYQRQSSYKASEIAAREKAVGFWAVSTCNGDTKRPGATVVVVPAIPGVPPLDKHTCPSDYPIKGNQGGGSAKEWIYHLPGGQSYAITDPEECFSTEGDAAKGGYEKASR